MFTNIKYPESLIKSTVSHFLTSVRRENPEVQAKSTNENAVKYPPPPPTHTHTHPSTLWDQLRFLVTYMISGDLTPLMKLTIRSLSI